MKSADDVLQRGDRGQVHEQGDEAANVAIFDHEVDVKEQDQVVGLRAAGLNIKQRRAIAANNGGQRHPHRATQDIRDRGQACVQDDISGLRESLLLQIDYIL